MSEPDRGAVASLVDAIPRGGSLRAAADSLHLAALAVVARDDAEELRAVAIDEHRRERDPAAGTARSAPPALSIASSILAAVAIGVVAAWRGDLVIDDVRTAAPISAATAALALLLAVVAEGDRERRPPADYPHVGAALHATWAAAWLIAAVLIAVRAGESPFDSAALLPPIVILVSAALASASLALGARARDRHRRARRAVVRATAPRARSGPADLGRGVVAETRASAVLLALSPADRDRLLDLELAAIRAVADRDGADATEASRAEVDARLRLARRPPLLGPAPDRRRGR
ncbi:hypothetical protein [Yonghaparkia sp. Root332]|uniref:hypothetical protein n=1 Tax=Yonghaparkia sp. Root332 TaxID=1736516 RepID=UPI0006FD9E67|nr:hypothetical protein [Yonghaparkia sp. Root332]KQV26095.1 hypothetical protein ASC54_03945 [Yonghaparkia sp. Root332]